MKLKEIANLEDKFYIELSKIVKENCSEYLSEAQGSFPLCHGSEYHQEDMFIEVTLSNRRPKNTLLKYHYALEQIFDHAGFEARRSNSLFCFGNPSEAAFYGDVYVIFPYNGFSFSWCSKAGDLTATFNLDVNTIGRSNWMENSFKQDLLGNYLSPDEFCEKWGFEDTNLVRAANSKHEVLIHGKFLAVKLSDPRMNYKKDTTWKWAAKLIGNLN